MTALCIDYETVYRDIPVPILLMTPEFVIADANQAYLEATGRTQDELIGHDFFAAFPDNPGDPSATGVRDVSRSLARVLATGEPDGPSVQRYDVELPGHSGLYARRYWSAVNVPVFGPEGQIVLIAHCAEEITERVQKFIAGLKEAAVRG